VSPQTSINTQLLSLHFSLSVSCLPSDSESEAQWCYTDLLVFVYICMLLLQSNIQAFHSIVTLAEARSKHPEFCIPMVIIPSTISNNVPGTDFSLGSDTSLNEIADVCMSALHSG